jgi:hypothetical protein
MASQLHKTNRNASGKNLIEFIGVIRHLIWLERSLKMKSISRLVRIGSVIALAVLLSHPALAQYPGGGTGSSTGGVYTPPKGGYKTSTGIAVGAAAAVGVAVTYLVLHKTSMVGCVADSADGLQLTDDKDSVAYQIVGGGQDLAAGRHVEVKGKKVKADGKRAFRVKNVKDLGPCSENQIQARSVQTP